MSRMENKNHSKYFGLFNIFNRKNFSISEFKGWNGLLLIKLNFKKGSVINSTLIKSKFFDINLKEKIFFVVSGVVELKLNKQKFNLKEYDALNFFYENENYEIFCTEDAEAYIISVEGLKKIKKSPIFFNFKKDIIPNDIWGGQCISRVYFGESLNLVMFDLKPGFKFHDNGHENEQITWVVKGTMDFYVENAKKKLSPDLGVDIGKSKFHGGVSNGAIGFDAFYPKREEKKYK